MRLVTAAGDDPRRRRLARSASERGSSTAPLLEALAVVEPAAAARTSAPGWLDRGRPGGLTVAVLGALEPADLPVLRRMQHHAAVALALALDVEAWAGAAPAPAVAAPGAGPPGLARVGLDARRPGSTRPGASSGTSVDGRPERSPRPPPTPGAVAMGTP